MSICKTTQGFGANANSAYANSGMKGHSGVDETCGYGSKIYALKKGVVYKILDKTHPARDGSGYWGVFIISQEKNGRFSEWSIGHLSKIYVKVGDVVNPWDFIGEEGNRGKVFFNGIEITRSMQDAGDTRGSHRHYNKKILTKLMSIVNRVYLTEWTAPAVQPIIYKDKEGCFYAVDNAENGYSGSVDCAIDIADGRKDVENYFAVSPTPLPMVEKPVSTGTTIRVRMVFNNNNWTTIPEKVKIVKDFYASKFNIQCDIAFTAFNNIPFRKVIGSDGSSGIETHITTDIVDPNWFDSNITSKSLAYDMVLFHLTNADKQGYVTSAGVRTDQDQGPVELTVFGGNENDHVYNQGVDMGDAFAFIACHEIAHGIAMMFKIPDTVHKHFYTSNPKLILNEYNFTQNAGIKAVLDRIARALAYMFTLIRK